MPNQRIEPWMHGAFELIQEGTERLESGTDAGTHSSLFGHFAMHDSKR
jgi:hypothetical protein